MNDVTVTDYHTAGEPFRIVTQGVPALPGASVLERREYAQTSEDAESVRRLLVHEPRGHADMYGCFVVPPDDADADFGVLFWHKDGYSTACGHGTIALATWALETGRVARMGDGDVDVVIDVPSGRVTARATCSNGRVDKVAFRNVPAYVVATGVEIATSRGTITVDISYGGAFYVSVSASSVGLAVTPEHYHELIAIGREVKWLLNDSPWASHPSDPRLNGIYGTILFDDLGQPGQEPRQANVTVFADGEVDRSPCGSGTSARIALLVAQGRLQIGQSLHHTSIIGTEFVGRVVERVDYAGRPAVITEVEGAAYRTGTATFTLDPRDPIGPGFVLR